MFKVVSETLAWWPVIFAGVTEEGAVVENKIELRFRILDEDEIDEFGAAAARAVAGAKSEGVSEKNSVRMQRVLEPVVRDWRLVAGANGEPMPFGDANFQALLRVPNVFPAILSAYGACRAGREDVRAGN